jgi:hypothetical protein
MALGIRSGILGPLDGYDIADNVPVIIQHGIVDTTRMGSGYFTIYGVAWETSDNGETNTTLTLQPRDDDDAPADELIATAPLSTTPEWEIGWEVPDPLVTFSRYFLNQTTGIAYYRDDDDDLYYERDTPGGVTYPEAMAVPAAPAVTSSTDSVIVDLQVTP